MERICEKDEEKQFVLLKSLSQRNHQKKVGSLGSNEIKREIIRYFSMNKIQRWYLWTALLCAVFSIASCMNDDEFTTDAGALLTFEADTVKFDTVFTTIGSSTKRFKVFNTNKKGVRCQSVALESGGANGFRINVDGHSGALLTDIEIPGKDSIFIFAEVTLNPQSSDTPVLVRDKILFTLENGRQQQLVLQAYGQDIIVLRAEEVTADRILTGVRPYLIYDSLVVKEGATLTIDAGTTLCFHDKAYLGVHGTVVSNGTQEKPVIFRGDRIDRMFTNLPYDFMDAQWGGVTLHPESTNNLFTHTDIHSGTYGIACQPSTTTEKKLTLESCIIHNVSGHGLMLHSCIVEARNSQITNAGGDCIHIVGGNHDFVHCTIAQFQLWHSGSGTALSITNTEDKKDYPLDAANFYNCLITGWSNDEIIIVKSKQEDVALNYFFKNSLINIKMTGSESDEVKARFVDCFNESNLKGEDVVKGEKNFQERATYQFNFNLSEQSNARGIGSNEYVTLCPIDLNGVERPTEKPDAGCFQFRSDETIPKE